MIRLFLAQLGFLPISVLLVTIIISQLLSQRARAAKLRKLNMVIGAFFSEVGTELLIIFSGYDLKLAELRRKIITVGSWLRSGDFTGFQQRLGSFGFKLSVREGNLENLRDFLKAKGIFSCACSKTPTCWSTTPLPICCWRSFISPKN